MNDMTNEHARYQVKKGGWSIVETLMVASLVAILVSIAIVVVNPIARLSVTRNAERWGHVNIIANEVVPHLSAEEMKDVLLPGGVPFELCQSTIEPSECEREGLFVVGQHGRNLPVDPLSRGNGTGYAISRDTLGRVVVSALLAEDGDVITVLR
jgi:hypothetical protein